MDFFIDNILYIALFFTIFTVVFYFVRIKSNPNKINSTSKKISDSEMEIKLRAYERLTLFLERIEPIGMINRLELHSLKLDEIKAIIIKNIVVEYEYNISQQIYVSDKLWTVIELVKNKIINNISFCVESLSAKSTTDELVQIILKHSKENNLLIQRAKKILKEEVRSFS